MTHTMESLSLQADKGQYDYRPQRKIDTTEYKWLFEDIKPLTNSSTPLQFRIDDRPFPFCPREMGLHLRVNLKWPTPRPPPITPIPPCSSWGPSIISATAASAKCAAKSTMPRQSQPTLGCHCVDRKDEVWSGKGKKLDALFKREA